MPRTRPLSPPDMPLASVFGDPPDLDKARRVFAAGAATEAEGDYPHWDKVRQLTPPEGLTHEEWWTGIKFSRGSNRRAAYLKDSRGRSFTYVLTDRIVEMLHRIDQNASGRIAMSEEVTNPATRDRYIVSSLIEEAITSSQLEGADTARKIAKEMIRSGRPPRDVSERMIFNNYVVMEKIRDWGTGSISADSILDLHKMLTRGTLHNEEAAGRMQLPGEERVQVWDRVGRYLLHTPPPAEELPQRLDRLCAFINGTEAQGFVHPVIRSIIAHFALAYDHPFEDGNGRTARALFYWSMLREGYWLAEFLSISRILKRAPAKYMRSFLYTETDDNDLTYFLLYHLEVILRSIDELRTYLDRKIKEIRAAESLIRATSVGFNHRQLALLSHALRNPGTVYTMQSHGRSHNVVYETARSDLQDLATRELLIQRKIGRAFHYFAASDLASRLRTLK